MSLDALAQQPRWVAWRNEPRGRKVTKVPYAPNGKKAKSDDPSTWGTRAEAEARAKRIVNGQGGGTGIQLGDLGEDTFLGGIDLDSCIADDGTPAPWAAAILNATPTYTERSPSGRGLKLFFYLASDDVRPFLERIGADQWGVRRGIPGEDGRDHGPAVEIYLAGRYFTVTGDQWAGAPAEVAMLDNARLDRLAPLIPPAKSVRGGADNSRSAIAFRVGLAKRRAGKTYAEFCEELRRDPQTATWYVEKGIANGGRELHRIWQKAGAVSEKSPARRSSSIRRRLRHRARVPRRALRRRWSTNTTLSPRRVLRLEWDGLSRSRRRQLAGENLRLP